MRPPALAIGAVLFALPGTAMAGGDLRDVRTEACAAGRFAGAYVGVHAGYLNPRSEQTALNNGAHLESEDDAWHIGAHAGYDWQCGRLVYGVVGDLSWADAEASATLAEQTLTTSHDYFGTLRGRVGITHENVLFYVTGGLAFARLDHEFDWPAAGFRQSDSDTRFGWTAGGGIEFARDRWLIRAEALYVDLGDTKIDYAFTGPPCIGTCTSTIRWEDDFFLARIGVSLRLHREAPPPAPLK